MAIPASVPVDGTRTVTFISSVTNPAAVKVAEANGGKDLSCYLTGDGWAPTGDQATITDDRWCSTQTFERPGRKTKSLTLRYVFNLAVAGDDVARINIPEGTAGYLVNRLQKTSGGSYVNGDWYEIWPVKFGEQRVLPAEANSVDRIEQKAFVTGEVLKFKQIVT